MCRCIASNGDHPLTFDKAQGGVGIGLAFVQKIVQMHGGTVGAEGAGIGRGSTFTVRLPLASGTRFWHSLLGRLPRQLKFSIYRSPKVQLWPVEYWW
jgi:hypothetical protein